MVKRGHTVYHSKKAIAMLKSIVGAKILGHIMPDLPGSSPEMDLESISRQDNKEALLWVNS